MDYLTLKSLEPSEFADAADGYRTASDMASQAKDRLNGQITAKMREALEGRAALAALKQLKQLSKNFHFSQVECGLASASLNALTSDLRAAKKKLDAAVDDAQCEKFTVNSDGSVSYPAAGDKVDGKVPEGGTVTGSASGPGGTSNTIDPSGTANDTADALMDQAGSVHPNPNYGNALEYANRIATALQEATEVDELWAPKLRGLKADDDLTVSHSDWADAQKDMRGVRKSAEEYLDDIKAPPKDATPKQNADWWKSLSEQERADYISLRPASVGTLDGLPADVRDEANRIVLAEKRGSYHLRLEALPPEPDKYVPGPSRRISDEWREWQEHKGEIESAIKGMDAIQERFDRTGVDSRPEAYLLGFAPEGEGDGRVIIANGNPDTADHTAVYIPGTGTDLGSIGGNIERGESMWTESNRLAPSGSVSTITWLDYNAPDDIPEAMGSSYATEAGPRLQQFLEGAQVAQGGAESSHTTVMGHSYGSTVLGEAAKFNQLPADDVLVAGSPGMQVEHARDLDVGADHVWAMGADWTYDDTTVRQGGRLVGLGEGWTIPTDEGFGGNIMRSDAEGHGEFWDSDDEKSSVSLKNQARVITGRYGSVDLEE